MADEDQIARLWVECALSRCDSGLNIAASKYSEKDLALLSESELAGLIAAVEGPAGYAPRMEAGIRRAKAIIKNQSSSGKLSEIHHGPHPANRKFTIVA